jgi:transposase InsO family protein
VRTPVLAPKANSFVERLIGTLRRECLDHVLVLNEAHLQRVLDEYLAFFNDARPHQGIDQRRLSASDRPWRPTLPSPSAHSSLAPSSAAFIMTISSRHDRMTDRMSQSAPTVARTTIRL